MRQLVELADITDVTLGQTFRSRAESDLDLGVRLIQIKDIQAESISSVSGLPFADIDLHNLKIQLQSGDILVPLRGFRFDVAIFEPESITPVTTLNQVAIIRCNVQVVLPKFLFRLLNTNHYKENISKLATGTVQKAIKKSDLEKLIISIPSIKEQKKIIEISDNWQKQKDTIHKIIDNGNRINDIAILGQKIT